MATYGETYEPRPCRSCTDFKTWARQQRAALSKESREKLTEKPRRDDCPVDREELGRNTWSFLHTMAAYYPEKPSCEQKADMTHFFVLLSKFYPCSYCAEELREQLKVKPPVTDSQQKLSKWLCEIHNNVNKRLGKPLFDCSRVNERWKDGWLDGSCD